MSDLLRIELLVDRDIPDSLRAAEDAVSLLEELRELDVKQVEVSSSGAPPPGAKSVSAVDAGSLVVLASTSRVVLKSVFGLVQDWLARRQSGTVTVKINGDELTLTYASRDAQSQALQEFRSRHEKKL